MKNGRSTESDRLYLAIERKISRDHAPCNPRLPSIARSIRDSAISRPSIGPAAVRAASPVSLRWKKTEKAIRIFLLNFFLSHLATETKCFSIVFYSETRSEHTANSRFTGNRKGVRRNHAASRARARSHVWPLKFSDKPQQYIPPDS
jgi:hypothetical protein